MLKLGIIGSRNFIDKEFFICKVNEVFAIEGLPTLVISGGAVGADALAEEWAIENEIEFQVFKPQHKDFPKSIRRFAAPHARNTLIAEHSDVIIAFWDGQSTGTKDTINKAIALSKKVYIFEIKIINP
jgi:uncharacterized phage-like protein YoqJ